MNEPVRRFLHNGLEIPPGLISNVSKWSTPEEISHGWIERLSDTVAHFAETWDITFEPELPNSYLNLVLLGHSAQLGPVVFKSAPISVEFRAEATALKLAGGQVLSRLYDVDFERSAMIVERIVPGIQLRHAELTDTEATTIAAMAAKTMWIEIDDQSALHPLRTWMRELFEWESKPDRIPDQLVHSAQELGGKLLGQSTRSCLIHGDLHHENLLRRASGDWALIDPKGVYGDPAFEVAAWMYNPDGITDRDDYTQVIARRLEIFSEIWGIDRAHLTRWAFVGSVLSAVWSANGPAPNGWWKASLVAANHLRQMI